ncbi:MAG: tetratricopeptide repeat-containing sensor histidine kinase [Cyclobacteriaceae bacterium]|nr:tetratricopeptide repeat-containing sensor histidine kinase [Cyclobacteriaceae bacterium]
MKKLVLVFFLYSVIPGYTQQTSRSIDSLTAALQTGNLDPRNRTDVLNSLAVHYYNIDLKKSIAFGEEALELAQQQEYDKGIQQALNILMRVNRRLGNFTVAIELALNKLPVAERLQDTSDLIDTYSSLGNIYSSLNNYAEAKKYLNKALTLGQKVNASSLSSTMNFMGRAYGKMGQYDSAQYWITQALLREQQISQPGYTLSYIYNNLAEVFYFQRKHDAALSYYILSLNLPEERKSPFGATFTLNGLARIYKDKKDYKKAIDLLNQSLKISLKNSYRDRTKDAYGILHEVYEEMNDFKNALSSYKKFNLYQDSIFSEDKLRYIENLQVNYETERVARENEILRKDAELKDARLREQRNLAIGGVITVISLVALSTILYFSYQQKKKTNAILAKHSESLEKEVNERTKELVKSNLELVRQNTQLEQFGFITAHNLRAPVARILGLTNLITGGHLKMPEDSAIIDKLQFTAEELDSIIHDLNTILEIKKGIHQTFEKVNLQEYFEKVKSILRDQIHDSSVTIRESLKTKSCYGIPAYVESILYNLVSNAIKYRSADRIPIIEVTTVQEGNYLKLTVKDNGVGIDMEKQKEKIFNLYQRFHSHVEGKGLGLFLVKTQVDALNGKIEIQSETDVGTTFTIYLPSKLSSI